MIDGSTMAGRPSRLKSRMQGEHSPTDVDEGVSSSLCSAHTRDLARGCRVRLEVGLVMPRRSGSVTAVQAAKTTKSALHTARGFFAGLRGVKCLEGIRVTERAATSAAAIG